MKKEVTVSAKQQATDFLCPTNLMCIRKVGRVETYVI
jgi:hypothetical protein